MGKLTPADLLAATSDPDPLVRIHAQRMLSETRPLSPELAQALIEGLRDPDGFVRRAAADAAGQHPELDAVDPLLELLPAVPAEDIHLRHAVRMALRNQLLPADRLSALRSAAPDRLAIAVDVLPGINTEEAARCLLTYLQVTPPVPQKWPALVEHAARYSAPQDLPVLVALVRQKAADDSETNPALFNAIERGVQLRGLQPPQSLVDWGEALVEKMLDSVSTAGNAGWHANSSGPKGSTDWIAEQRTTVDGKSALFLSSLPLGEQYTGVLQSKAFALPGALSFYVCGHLGPIQDPPIPQNRVRLKLVSSGEVLAEVLAPRNDVAQPVHWDLSRHVGQNACLEVIDGVDSSLYAWIAVGRFEPALLSVPDSNSDAVLQQASALIGRLKLSGCLGKLKEIVGNDTISAKTRAAAALALVAIHPQAELAVLCTSLGHESVSAALMNRLCRAIADENVEEARFALEELMRSAPERLQLTLALKLSEQAGTAETLLALVERGVAPARLLQNATLAEKLRLAAPEQAPQRIEALTAGLPPLSAASGQLIAERRRNFSAAQASVEHGRELFVKNCAACHQIGGQGAIVGPQLDGIGNRGAERIVEDLLDPNRNVDPVFRTTVYALEDGRVVSGLFRRTDGDLTIVSDNAGKEVAIATDEIAEQRKTTSSLMPDNFGISLAPADFNDLVAFLISDQLRAAAPSTPPDARSPKSE